MEHRSEMQTVLHQLLENHEKRNKRNEKNERCCNCNAYEINEEYTSEYFGNKHYFCGVWCAIDYREDMKRMWRRSKK